MQFPAPPSGPALPGSPPASHPREHAASAGRFGLWDWDVPSGRVTWSDSLYAIHGVERGQFVPSVESFIGLVDPEDLPRVQEAVRQTLADGAPYEIEFRIRRPDGSRVWVYTSATLLRDQGRPVRVIGATLDTTAWRAGEDARHLLAAIVESSEDAILSINLEGVITSWNAGAERLYGYSAAEAIGRPITLVVPEERQAEEHGILDQIRRGIRLQHNETVRRRKDGSRVDVSLTVSPIRDVNGRVVGASKIARDISGRKAVEQALRESERLYRAIGESIEYGVWVCDADGKNIYASDSFLRLVGLTQEQCSEFGWGNVLHPDEAEATIAAWRECSQRGTTWEREHRFRGVDGRWHPVLARGVPIRDSDGRILRWVGINLDISRIKQAEETAHRRSHILERLNTVGSQLVAERDLQKLVQLVTDTGRDVSGAALGAFFYNVVNAQGEAYTLYTLSGAARHAFANFPMPRATKLFGPTFRGEAPTRIADVLADARYGQSAPHFGMPPGHPPVRSYLAVPVVSRSGEVLGGLFFGHPEPGVFTAESEAIIVALAAQAAIAIDNAKLYAALQKELEEQRRAEILLRESERRWRQLAEAMPHLVWSCRPDGLCDFLSPQWVAYTGLPEAEQLGEGWLEQVHPDDQAVIRVAWEQAVTAGTMLDTEFRIRGADRIYRWFKTRAVPVHDDSGRIVRWYGSNTDIEDVRRAERAVRESEQQLRLVADHAPIFLAQLDRQHRYKFVNQPYAERYGRARDEIIGRHVAEFTGGAAYEIFRPHLDRALQGVRVEFEQEIPYETLGRSWVHMIYEPERDAEGRVVGLIAVIMDISARKRTEQELERARDEALAASRAKDDFLAALSHELRTPLSPVLLLASDAAGNPSLPREIRENFELIRSNISLEARLIDDLLDLTRITRGKMAFDRQTVDLHEVIRAALTHVSRDLEGKQLGLTVSLAAARTHVQGDPVRLQQVCWNLLMNAVKFTDRDGRIHVTTHNTADLIQVRIADTGLGLTADELPRVFEAFAQGEHASGGSQRFGGLGLGLAISRRLVELHAGRIFAESPGRNCGAVFTVELPLAARDSARRPARPDRPSGRAETSAPGPAARILLVEDHVATRETLERLLTRRNFSVTAVGTAAEARLQVVGQEFDVFVSDVGLPDGDGYELMAEFHRAHPELRGIAVSGYGMEDDLQRSQAAGFAVHLVKPVSIGALEEAIARLLAAPSS